VCGVGLGLNANARALAVSWVGRSCRSRGGWGGNRARYRCRRSAGS